eukprot:g52733.t1
MSERLQKMLQRSSSPELNSSNIGSMALKMGILGSSFISDPPEESGSNPLFERSQQLNQQIMENLMKLKPSEIEEDLKAQPWKDLQYKYRERQVMLSLLRNDVVWMNLNAANHLGLDVTQSPKTPCNTRESSVDDVTMEVTTNAGMAEISQATSGSSEEGKAD